MSFDVTAPVAVDDALRALGGPCDLLVNRVNAVSPGRIGTPPVRAPADRGIEDDFVRRHVPLERLGAAEVRASASGAL